PQTYFTLNPQLPSVDFHEFYGCGFRLLPPIGELQVSDDGIHYRTICALRPKYKNMGGTKEQTVSFPTTQGRYFRISLHDWGTNNQADNNLTFGNVVLSARASVDAWQEKASLISEILMDDNTPRYHESDLMDFSKAVDLTQMMDAEGNVTWRKAPKGKWLVLRFFSISNGGHTKHGRADALGLECDKLSVEGARLQWKSYVKPVIDSIRAHHGMLTGICMDSHEAGPQNWTVGFEREFLRLRGYDMSRFLPVMAGYVVGSVEESNKFLYDLRHTINDLIADRYFGEFNRLCRAEGLTLTAQAIGGALCLAGDAISVKRFIDKPQAEFWAYQTEGNYDIKDCSSSAHLYGKQIASGEAFTDATYKHTLADIKNLADYAYSFGINEFVVCAVAYQPWVRRTIEPLKISTANGRQYVLNRLNTFWELSRPFWDYQARCSWLLRQGKPVSDFCLYLGDNVPMRILGHRLPDIPQGYDFDAFTTDALLNRMSVKDGRVVLPDGISYRMMILPSNEPLTPKAAQQIEAFRQQGVLMYNPQTDNRSLSDVLQEVGLKPDVEALSAQNLYFCHRRTAQEDIYFLNNHSDQEIVDCFRFNVVASQAELWIPVNGEKTPLSIVSEDGRTAIDLTMAPRESFFVILSNQPSMVSS
ncbi:MAG: glycosyl hydrolase family 2, partial [Prevotella sp.]|nr:glycosyl hydrolase family 2 [Prevotella sp.]